MSIDPVRQKEKFFYPISWNKYAYGLNSPKKFVDPDGREAFLAIVEPSEIDDNKKGLVGHAALYVTSNDESAGISLYGAYNFNKGLGNFLLGYASENRSTRIFLLETTPEQDARMIEFLSANPSAGVDREGSIVSENCTTAVCNTLEAGNVLPPSSRAGKGLGGIIYSPKFLLNAVLSGDIKVQSEIFVQILEAAKGDSE